MSTILQRLQKAKLRIRAKIKHWLLSAAWSLIRRYGAASWYFTNIGLDATDRRQKRALISYITDSLRYDVMKTVGHTNALEQAVILKTLSDIGYCCDVARFDDVWNLEKIGSQKYDLVFGFGEPYALACKNNPHAIKMIYLTGAALDSAYAAEQERFRYYEQRHGRAKGLGRISHTALHSADDQADMSDVGSFYRNPHAVSAYKKSIRICRLSCLRRPAL